MLIQVLTRLESVPTIENIGRSDHRTLVVSSGSASAENRLKSFSPARSARFSPLSPQAQNRDENHSNLSQNGGNARFPPPSTLTLPTAPDTRTLPFRGVWCPGRQDSGGRWDCHCLTRGRLRAFASDLVKSCLAGQVSNSPFTSSGRGCFAGINGAGAGILFSLIQAKRIPPHHERHAGHAAHDDLYQGARPDRHREPRYDQVEYHQHYQDTQADQRINLELIQ